MAHISQKKVEVVWLEQIKKLLHALLANPSGRTRKNIVNDLLTDVEQLMLGKRIALVAMIAAEFSTYTIARRLRVSTSTTKRFRRLLDGGAYQHLKKELQRLKQKEEFWENIENLSRAGFPPIVGRRSNPTLLRKHKG